MLNVAGHSAPSRESQQPWYKQFWPWFLISIPAVSVCAGVAMVLVAVSHRDSLVTDDYYRAGITINTALAEVDRAFELGIVAEVAAIQDRLLSLHLATGGNAPAELAMAFRHPTQAENDFTVRLPAMGDGVYSGVVERVIDGKWLVVLAPAGAEADQWQWRLQGTWRDPHQRSLALGFRQ